MITPFLFWVFAAIGAILSIYVFLDNENRIFGHIFASVVATILFFLLGVNLMTGNVGEAFPVSSNATVVNNTTTYVYGSVTVSMQDSGISWFFIFLGVVMLIVTVMAVLEQVSQVVQGSDLSGYDEDDV